MIQELLYTSHEGRGLRQGGGGGFCTVLSTTGMAANLASTLEKLSGYKHPFDIHDPRSQNNPVNHRLAVVRVGGIAYYVLSRIADLRREHTGRSNKLAHHIALTEGDLSPGGPTRLLMQRSLVRDAWDGKVELVEPIDRASLPKDDMPPRVCDAWHLATGDAGWAGYVAEQLLASTVAPVSVIFPTGTDTLALADDIFTLLPAEQRWETTFSTYYAAAPPVSTCRLRFVLDETSDSDQLRRDHRQVVVDLAKSLGQAPHSALVNSARTGVFDHSREARRRTAPAALRPNEAVTTNVLTPLSAGEYELQPPELRTTIAQSRGDWTSTSRSGKRGYAVYWTVGIGGAAALLLLTSVLYMWLRVVRPASETPTVAAAKSGESVALPQVQTDESAQESIPRDANLIPAEGDKPVVADTVPDDETRVLTGPPEQEISPVAVPAAAEGAHAATREELSPAKQTETVVDDVSDQLPVAEIIPWYKLKTGSLGEQDKLPSVPIEGITEIKQIELFGWEWISDQWQKRVLSAKLGIDATEDGLVIRAFPTSPNRLDNQPSAPLCTFNFSGGALGFAWSEGATKKVDNSVKAGILNSLRWCVVKVIAKDGRIQYVRLAHTEPCPTAVVLVPGRNPIRACQTSVPAGDHASLLRVAPACSDSRIRTGSGVSHPARLAVRSKDGHDSIVTTFELVQDDEVGGTSFTFHRDFQILELTGDEQLSGLGKKPVEFADNASSNAALDTCDTVVGRMEALHGKRVEYLGHLEQDLKLAETQQNTATIKQLNLQIANAKSNIDELDERIRTLKEFVGTARSVLEATCDLAIRLELPLDDSRVAVVPICGLESDARIRNNDSGATQ